MPEPQRYLGEDPNFPENLDIQPSLYFRSVQNTSIVCDHRPDVFGTHAQEVAIRQYGIAGRVWEAAYAMVSYVRPIRGKEFNPPFIDSCPDNPRVMIELGSGVGLVSTSIADVLDPEMDSIIATDLPEVCPLLENTLREAFQSSIENCISSRDIFAVRSLAWGNSEHALQIADEFLTQREHEEFLTHIICSDLVYFPTLLAPLLRTLIQLSSPPFCRTLDMAQSEPPLKVIISYKVRSLAKETSFWSAFGLWFEFEPVLVKDASTADVHWRRFGSEFEDEIFIFVAQRRSESFSWPVPSDDDDLLNGVGVYGSDAVHGDDTFESLLLMSLNV